MGPQAAQAGRVDSSSDGTARSAKAGPGPSTRQGQAKSRSRSGCLGCRRTRIKCSETHPTCDRCKARSLPCEWPTEEPKDAGKKQLNPRDIHSCEPCRRKKVKCDGTPQQPCDRCLARGTVCTWPMSPGRDQRQTSIVSYDDGLAAFQPMPDLGPVNSVPFDPGLVSYVPHVSPQWQPATATTVLAATIPTRIFIQPSELATVTELVKLYFQTIHQFEYLSFIHEADYWERFDAGKAPESLTLAMAANALRFGGRPQDQASLQMADRWAASVGDRLLSQMLNEFGALELMELLLCQHYDFLCGRYSRGWIMAGMAVRMMTFLRLHILDESPHPAARPLLSVESLRRLAWATWFLDETIEGGQFGFGTIQNGALTIQLPCDERPFLLKTAVLTEPLVPPTMPSMGVHHLGIGGHLLRAMSARSILADAHSRIRRRLIDVASIAETVRQAEASAIKVLSTLPPDMAYSRTLYHVHKDQLPMLVHLHIMRNTCHRHMALLRLYTAQYLETGLAGIPVQRQRLVDDAKALSAILNDAEHFGVVLDPQLAMHAYNGIEVLLFQPLRLSSEGRALNVTQQEVGRLLKPLLNTVRKLAQTCDLVALIHPEAINRMIHLGYVDDLTNEDIMAVLKKVHSLANSVVEFDFNESFWRYEVSLSRQQPSEPIMQSPNDRLLEITSDTSPQNAAFAEVISDPVGRLQNFISTRKQLHSRAQSPQEGELPQTAGLDTWDTTGAFQFPFPDLQTMLENPQTSTIDMNPFPFAWSFSDGSGHL